MRMFVGAAARQRQALPRSRLRHPTTATSTTSSSLSLWKSNRALVVTNSRTLHREAAPSAGGGRWPRSINTKSRRSGVPPTRRGGRGGGGRGGGGRGGPLRSGGRPSGRGPFNTSGNVGGRGGGRNSTSSFQFNFRQKRPPQNRNNEPSSLIKELKPQLQEYQSILLPTTTVTTNDVTLPDNLQQEPIANTDTEEYYMKQCTEKTNKTRSDILGSILHMIQTIGTQLQEQEDATITDAQIIESELCFRNICRKLQEIDPSSDPITTEDGRVQQLLVGDDTEELIFRALVQLRYDRSQLIHAITEKAREATSDQPASDTSVLGSLKDAFSSFFTSNDAATNTDTAAANATTSNTTQNILDGVTAHMEPSYAPKRRHLRDLTFLYSKAISTLGKQQDMTPTQGSPTMNEMQKLAQQCTSLLSFAAEYEWEIPHVSILHAIRAQGMVGTLSSAKQALEIFQTYCHGDSDVMDANAKKWSTTATTEAFLCVLRAYVAAARREVDRSNRSTAATEVEKLVLQDSPVMKNTEHKGILVATAIDALSQAGYRAVPKVCARVDHLAIEYLGESTFERLLEAPENLPEKRAQQKMMPSEDLLILDRLIGVYAGQSPEKVEQAKHILEKIEQQHALRWGGKDLSQIRLQQRLRNDRMSYNNMNSIEHHLPSELSFENDVIYPNIETYRKMISSLRTHMAGLRKHKMKSKDDLKNCAVYATSLLGKMEKRSIVPDLHIYSRLLKIWLLVPDDPDVAPQAELILAKMKIRAFCDAKAKIKTRDYHDVMQCWALSCKDKLVAAAKADCLLRTMEIQSGAGLATMPSSTDAAASSDSPSDESDATPTPEQEMLARLYNPYVMPTTECYDLVLNICSQVSVKSKAYYKKEAATRAVDVYRRFQKTNLTPSVRTYVYVANCLHKLLPRRSPLRKEWIPQLLADAKANQRMNASFKAAVRAGGFLVPRS